MFISQHSSLLLTGSSVFGLISNFWGGSAQNVPLVVQGTTRYFDANVFGKLHSISGDRRLFTDFAKIFWEYDADNQKYQNDQFPNEVQALVTFFESVMEGTSNIWITKDLLFVLWFYLKLHS